MLKTCSAECPVFVGCELIVLKGLDGKQSIIIELIFLLLQVNSIEPDIKQIVRIVTLILGMAYLETWFEAPPKL